MAEHPPRASVALPAFKLQRAGMPDGYRAQLIQGARTELSKRGLGFLDQKVDDVAGPLRPERAKAPQESLAGESRRGPERIGAHHVAAAAHAGIHHHCRARADLPHDCRKHVDRRRQRLDLPSAVIGDDEAVDAERYGRFGVLRMQDAL